jgi:hypothetical protein
VGCVYNFVAIVHLSGIALAFGYDPDAFFDYAPVGAPLRMTKKHHRSEIRVGARS